MNGNLLVRGGIDVHGTPLDVAIVGGHISNRAKLPREAGVLDASGLTVAPGLLDLQVNGAAGVDVTDEPERLWEVGAALPAYGVTAFVPTVITSAPEARQMALATYATGPPADWAGALPLGLHFEGPMIAPERKGAHPEQWLRMPALELVRDWSREGGVVMATIAPELPGALDVIEALTTRGVIVSVGHTQANAAEVEAAAAAGARCVTHLANAMPPLAGRDPGPVGAVLASRALVAGVIADGHHLDPVTLKVFWTVLGPDRLLTVSDTTAALGLPDGPARLGDQDVVVWQGTVRLADGTLAGSAASLADCLAVLVSVTGCSVAEAVRAATVTPAALMGDASRGHLDVGARGDVVLLDGLEVAATVVGGEIVWGGR